MDLSALAVIDELVSEMQKQQVGREGGREGGTGGRREGGKTIRLFCYLAFWSAKFSISFILRTRSFLPPSLPPLPLSLLQVEVFIASASSRVVKSLEAYDLLDDVGGLPLVTLEVEDVFWAVLEDLGTYRAWLPSSPIFFRTFSLPFHSFLVFSTRFFKRRPQSPTHSPNPLSLLPSLPFLLFLPPQTSRKPKAPPNVLAPTRPRKRWRSTGPTAARGPAAAATISQRGVQ